MMSAKRLGSGILVSIAGLVTAGCTTTPSYTPHYEQALAQYPGIQPTAAQAQSVAERFVALFNQLGTPAFIDSAQTLYADQLYNNDTLSLHSRKSTLITHFQGMNKRVSNPDVRLIHAHAAGDRIYIHWRMGFDMRFMGMTKRMMSYGISEIRINAAEQIILQQDYWDPNNGLLRELPVVGGLFGLVTPFKAHSAGD